MRAIPDEWLAPPNLSVATQVQRDLARLCETTDRLDPIRTLAGVDTSMRWRDVRGPIHAAAAPMAWLPAAPLAASSVTMVPRIPYVPGYLGFRETPAILAALRLLDPMPGLILVDGHGRAHPRRCGIATHLGVVADVPTIGCAKTLLCGRVEDMLGPAPGDRAPLVDRGELVGIALRTRARAQPVYISVGHRVSLDTAVAWVLRLCDGRRLPLPIRLAHDAANAARRAAEDA